MATYSVRILASQPLRSLLTIGGVALCIVLMLFLLAVYRGVADGAVEYIRHNETDFWVLQHNSWNILRGSSLLLMGHGTVIREVPGVESASPVLLILPGIKKGNRVATVFLAGYEPQSGIGGPPALVQGNAVQSADDIVLDRAFALKYQIHVGDTVQIRDEQLRVVGLSSGTNAFAIQYAFVSLTRAQSLVGFPHIVTCYLVKVRAGENKERVAQAILEELPGVEVYDHETFLRNNTQEMESGFLPLLYTIATIGVVVLTTIMSLLLSVNILERRKEFAVVKTLGAPRNFLLSVVIHQAMMITGAGFLLALLLFFPMCSLVQLLTPELTPRSSILQMGGVMIASVAIGLASSWISIHRLRRIYPLEAFS